VPSLKLLVVEDELPMLELMTEVLRSLEAEVRPISNSQEAAAMVNQEKFDGIFMDLGMPNLDGFGLAQKVRTSSWNRSTPIVIVTGRDEREAMHEAFSTGATFFLQKPVDRNKLVRLFRTVRGAMADNRRRYVRAPLQAEVDCQVGSKVSRGRTWNLSQGGLQVEVENLKPGEIVRVSFRLPGSSVTIESTGTVVWSDQGRQGIQFAKMGNQSLVEIQRFLTQVEKA
jgi:two-component system chemotaxis response regulator CheY